MSIFWYPYAAALSGLVIWYGVLVWLDRPSGGSFPTVPGMRILAFLSRLRWWRPLIALLLGYGSFRVLGVYLAAVHPVWGPDLEQLAGGRGLALFILDVGLREELVKLLLALPCLLWLPSRAGWQSALLAGATVGLGFATAENRWFFGGHAEPTLLVGRVFSTTALHLACTGLCGEALVQAWQRRSQAWGRFSATFLTVVVAHGLYDWAPGSGWGWLLTGGTSWLSQLIVIALMAWFFSVVRRTPPARAQVRAAAIWFVLGAAGQYALALGLTWMHWRTVSALWVCARECLWFLPSALFPVIFLVTVSSRTQLSSGFIEE
jgi:hypothetical protein